MKKALLLVHSIAFILFAATTFAQDTVKTEKKKWSVKSPFKKNNPDDTTKGSGGKSFSKMFGFLKKDVDTLKFHETFSLGIGAIVDSATSITESYEIFRFFQDNPLILDGRKIPVKLISHPSQASLAVTGAIHHSHTRKCKGVSNEKCDAYKTECKFQIWKNGFKVASVTDYQLYYPDRGDIDFLTNEVNTDYPLYDGSFRIIRFGLDKLYRSLYHYTGQDEKQLPTDDRVEKIMDCDELNEFKYVQSKRKKLDKRELAELLPGNVLNFCPPGDFSHTVYIKNEQIRALDEKTAKQLGLSLDDPVDIAETVNAIYRYVDYNEFKNLNSKFVPREFKLELEPIIAPKSSWVGAPLMYLLAADKFLAMGDWAAAEMTYDASIYISGEANSSMQVKHEIRKMAAQGLQKIALHHGRKVSAQYLQLIIDLTDQYLKSPLAVQRESEYRSDIKKFQEVCAQIDKEIDELKQQKFAGKVGGIVESVSGSLLKNKTMMKSGDSRFTKSGHSFNQAKREMNADLHNVQVKDKLQVTIEANKITDIESGSVYLSKMVWDVLNSDDLKKEQVMLLKKFASDKPVTLQKMKMLDTATPANQEFRLGEVIKQLIEIEKGINKYEKRNEKVVGTF